MGVEIERKFLVLHDGYKSGAKMTFIKQGFLNDDLQRTVRVRVADGKACITIKGPSDGPERPEFEYPVPIADAEFMINELCIPPILVKNRFVLQFSGWTWEVDEFMGDNAGLVIAEVELPDKGSKLELPEWIGREVTGETRYYNANLIRHPYKDWKGK